MKVEGKSAETEFKLTERQEQGMELLGGPARNILLEGGSRSGKTLLIIRTLVLRAIAAPGSRHAVLRFRFNHVKTSIIHDTLPKTMALCFPQVSWKLDKTDWFAEFPNKLGNSQIWFGGLDDKERTEKILGQEYGSIFFNEVSQLPYASLNLAMTRLAQQCFYMQNGVKIPLRLKAYFDCNPPSKAHWAYQMFHEKRDPETRQPLRDGHEYVYLKLNPTDNQKNLPAEYFKTLEALPARLRRRFLHGEYADIAPGALWTEEAIDMNRVDEVPEMVRVVVGIDPSGSGDEENTGNDEIGIVVGGLGVDGKAYVLEDLTVKAGPKTWGEIAVNAYDRHQADKVVAETNYGGDMVRFVVQTAKPNIPFKKLSAARGKTVRAEPIASLHEQGKIKFSGVFAQLEEELCAFTTNGYIGQRSPNRADAFVWVMSELFPGIIKEKRAKNPDMQQRSIRVFGQSASSGWMAS